MIARLRSRHRWLAPLAFLLGLLGLVTATFGADAVQPNADRSSSVAGES